MTPQNTSFYELGEKLGHDWAINQATASELKKLHSELWRARRAMFPDRFIRATKNKQIHRWSCFAAFLNSCPLITIKEVKQSNARFSAMCGFVAAATDVFDNITDELTFSSRPTGQDFYAALDKRGEPYVDKIALCIGATWACRDATASELKRLLSHRNNAKNYDCQFHGYITPMDFVYAIGRNTDYPNPEDFWNTEVFKRGFGPSLTGSFVNRFAQGALTVWETTFDGLSFSRRPTGATRCGNRTSIDQFLKSGAGF